MEEDTRTTKVNGFSRTTHCKQQQAAACDGQVYLREEERPAVHCREPPCLLFYLAGEVC